MGVYTDYSPVHCILQEQGTSKGLQRQLLAEEGFFNTLYKALHKKSLHFFFLLSSKTHWMSTLGSCQYHFMAMVFKLLVLHSRLENL